MSYVAAIASTLIAAGAGPGLFGGCAFKKGRDYWIPGQAHTDGLGFSRTPQRVPGNGDLPVNAIPIMDVAASPRQMTAGIYRQLVILPDLKSRQGRDVFAPRTLSTVSPQERHLVAITGHTPRDLSLYLQEIRRSDADLFEFLLLKDFRKAFVHRPSIINDPWPTKARSCWSGYQADYLPPVLALVVYAELSRLAHNQIGLLADSFDDGVLLTTQQFLNRVPDAASAGASRAVTCALHRLPFQSVSLTPPDIVHEKRLGALGGAWAEAAAATMMVKAAVSSGGTGAAFLALDLPAVHANYDQSPAFWTEAHGKSEKAWRHARPSATHWGLDANAHGAVGLLEISQTARAWNRKYRPDGARLAGIPKTELAHAIAAINFLWTVEVDGKAAISSIAAMRTDEHIGLSTENISEYQITLIDKEGDSLLRLAQRKIKARPRPSELGYTAAYHPHLWLDEEGDDIDEYIDLQRQAFESHGRARAGLLPLRFQHNTQIPANLIGLVRNNHRHKAETVCSPMKQHGLPMTLNPVAAEWAQLHAQTICPFSRDPMHEMLLRFQR